jgi:hypothetical protein
MSNSPLRFSVLALTVVMAGALLSGCVATGYGYGSAGYGYSADYYEPYGGIYGEWGPGYEVGPYRDGGGRRGPPSGGHAYRSAPASHSMPSIPTGGRGHR